MRSKHSLKEVRALSRQERNESSPVDRFAGVVLSGTGVIAYGSEHQPVAGVTARVETAGDIQSRVTATRLLTTGVLAFALKKKSDTRELYLTIEGPTYTWAVPVDPAQGSLARAFAARIATAAGAGQAAPAGLADELGKLAALRDRGVLTDEEFTAQKARLLT